MGRRSLFLHSCNAVSGQSPTLGFARKRCLQSWFGQVTARLRARKSRGVLYCASKMQARTRHRWRGSGGVCVCVVLGGLWRAKKRERGPGAAASPAAAAAAAAAETPLTGQPSSAGSRLRSLGCPSRTHSSAGSPSSSRPVKWASPPKPAHATRLVDTLPHLQTIRVETGTPLTQ